MEDISKFQIAKDWIEKLANGINPITSEPVKEDDIVNDVHISRCLFFVREMLDKIDTRETGGTRRKRSFWMSASDAEKIVITDACGIIQFTKTINESVPANMRQLTTVTVIKWLRNNGYLYEALIENNRKTNLPTEKGIKLGISVLIQQTPEGYERKRVIYDISAQKYMLQNIEAIALTK